MVPLVVIEGAVKVLCVSSQLLGHGSTPIHTVGLHTWTVSRDCVCIQCPPISLGALVADPKYRQG